MILAVWHHLDWTLKTWKDLSSLQLPGIPDIRPWGSFIFRTNLWTKKTCIKSAGCWRWSKICVFSRFFDQHPLGFLFLLNLCFSQKNPWSNPVNKSSYIYIIIYIYTHTLCVDVCVWIWYVQNFLLHRQMYCKCKCVLVTTNCWRITFKLTESAPSRILQPQDTV